MLELVFASDVIPLITRLENALQSNILSKLAAYRADMRLDCMNYYRNGVVLENTLLSTAELRNKMGLADAEYTRIEAFKRRVLGLAIKQINDLTDITADYEQHKQGRLVTGFTFSV